MNIYWKYIFFITLASHISLGQAKTKLIGISSNDREQLLTEFPLLEKNRTTPAYIDKVIRYLMKTKKFENIFAYTKNGQKQHIIEALPIRVINNIRIQGNREFPSNTLIKQINLSKEQVFNQEAVTSSGKSIKNFYTQNGFLNTLVQVKFNKISNTKINVTYSISEGLPCEISKIDVNTKNKYLKNKLVHILKTLQGRPLTKNYLTEANKKAVNFFTQNSYISSSLSEPNIIYSENKTKAEVSYKIREPFLYDLSIQGTKKESGYNIREYIKFQNFYRTGRNAAAELTARIKEYYLQKGYSRAKIKSSVETNRTQFAKNILIQVNEGNRIKIKNITFRGVFSKDNSYYEKFVLAHSSDLIENRYYNRSELENGFKNLILKLQNQGYLQAQITSSRAQYNNDKTKVQIYISFNEGPLTRIKNIYFTGLVTYKKAKLKKLLLLKKGAPLRKKELEKSLTKISDFYQNNGYLEMSLLNHEDNLIQFSKNGTEASLTFNIYEGPQVLVNDIVIQGNKKTQKYVILNELEFHKNNILNPLLIKESINRLRQTGLFRNIKISTLEKGSQISKRTVIVQLKERRPGLFTTGIGLTNEREITGRGFATVSYLNMNGKARSTTFKIEGNRVINARNSNDTRNNFTQNKIRLNYTEPYLFKSRTKGHVSLSRSQDLPEDQDDTVLEKVSANLSLSQRFSSKIKGSWTIIDISENKEFSIGDKNQNTPSINRIAFTGPQLELDFRNHPIYATSGTLSRFTFEYGSPLLGSSSSITYIRSTTSITHYTSFYDGKIIWSNSIQGGHLENLNPNSYVPYVTKGFTLGGSSTIRGLEAKNRFPNNQFEFGLSEGQSLNLTTSSSFYLFKSELRYPLWDDLEGAIFYDGGSVKVSGFHFPDHYRDAAGVGIRYKTPVGALTLDLGYNLDRKKNSLSSGRNESEYTGFISFRTY